MIKFDKIDGLYYMYSDKDIGKFWPFDSILIGWVYKWVEFEIPSTIKLKSWKNCIGYFDENLYLFEENFWKLFSIWIIKKQWKWIEYI